MGTETEFVPANIETGRIINVNTRDWTVDVVTIYGDKRHLDIPVSSPYLHFINGEGIYSMPEAGAICWVCQPSDGLWARPFVMGFQPPVDERTSSVTGNQLGEFAAGRPNLNPGDIMMRTRDENFLILRRGGVVQIGATPLAQRLYLPIDNIIRDMCGQYNMFNLAGEMTWTVDRTENSIDGHTTTHCAIRVKGHADEPLHVADLTIGSHVDEDLGLQLTIYDTGAEDRIAQVDCQITKTGDVKWTIQKDFTVDAQGIIDLKAQGNVSLESAAAAAALKGQTDVTIEAVTGILAAIAGTKISLTAPALEILAQAISIGAEKNGVKPAVLIGGSSAIEPLVLGTKLRVALEALCDALMSTVPAPGQSLGIVQPGFAAVKAQLAFILSAKHRTS
jgi:hypothetical protein